MGPSGDRLAKLGTPERETYEKYVRFCEAVALEACGKYAIKLVRADELPALGESAKQINRYLHDADIVIADLSGGSWNVVHGLGVRQMTGKPTILIGEYGNIPAAAEVGNSQIIKYRHTPAGLIQARTELELALAAGVQERLAATSVHPDERAPETQVPSSENDDEAPGLFETIEFLEREFMALEQDASEVSLALEELGRAGEAAAPDIPLEGAPPSALVVAIGGFARAIAEPAEELDTVSSRLSERMRTIDSGIRGVLRFIEELPEENRREHDEFLQQMVDMADGLEESMAGLDEVRQMLDMSKRLSRQLRKPAGKISASLRRINQVVACVNEWAETARALR
jgi:methyl-accepting chemotaxis protein